MQCVLVQGLSVSYQVYAHAVLRRLILKGHLCADFSRTPEAGDGVWTRENSEIGGFPRTFSSFLSVDASTHQARAL